VRGLRQRRGAVRALRQLARYAEVAGERFGDDPLNMLLADVYAKRHGFKDFLDARPLELLVIIVDDVKAIRAALDEAGYTILVERCYLCDRQRPLHRNAGGLLVCEDDCSPSPANGGRG
jgi:hypothetical protein